MFDSKYEQNVSYTVKRDDKTHANIYSEYSRKMVHQKRKKRSTKNVIIKEKKAI